MIAHALDNESGGNTGGFPGEQRGFELCTCKWYDYSVGGGWIAIYRLNDTEKAEGVAQWMEDAVANGYLGYNQNRTRRKEFFDHIAAYDFDVSKVCDNIATDCGGLVYTAIYSQFRIAATNAETDLLGQTIYGIPTTGLFDAYLMNDIADVVKYTDEAHLMNSGDLKRGDIMLADGHVAVWI